MECQNVFTWITCIIESMLFSGIFFGWPSLQSILVSEGFFTGSCIENTTNSTTNNTGNCKDDQTDRLSLIYTVTCSVGPFCTLITGLMFDKFGMWASRALLVNLGMISCILLAIANQKLSVLLFVALPALHAVGYSLHMGNIQHSNLFSNRRNLYVSTITGAFYSAPVLFFSFKYFHIWSISLSNLFWIYASIYFGLNIRTILLTPRKTVPCVLGKNFTYGIKDLHCFDRFFSNKKQNSKENLETSTNEPKSKEEESIFQIIRQGYFLNTVLSTSAVSLLTSFYSTNFISFIKSISSEDQKQDTTCDNYMFVFTLIQIGGILITLFIGLSADCYKQKLNSSHESKPAEMRSCLVGLFTGSSCLIAMQACTMVHSLPLQFFAMLMQVAANVCFFAGSNAFMSVYFPQKKFCTLYGAVTCIQASVLALQSLFQFMSERVFEGNFFFLNLILTFVSFLSLALPVFILFKTKIRQS